MAMSVPLCVPPLEKLRDGGEAGSWSLLAQAFTKIGDLLKSKNGQKKVLKCGAGVEQGNSKEHQMNMTGDVLEALLMIGSEGWSCGKAWANISPSMNCTKDIIESVDDLYYWKSGQKEIVTHVIEEPLQSPLPLDGASALQRRLRPPDQLVVKLPTACPLGNIGSTDSTRNQSHSSNARILLQQHVSESHPWTNTACSEVVNVTVERLRRRLPVEISAEAENCRIGGRLGRNVTVPFIIDYSATAGHVALTGEKKNGLSGVGIHEGNDETEIAKVKTFLKSQFLIKDLGLLKYFLGIEVIDIPNGLCLSQRKYCMELLHEFGIMSCKPVKTPLEPNLVIDRNVNEVADYLLENI
ncbi:hypothetical protein LXL04_008075 [Taraxacum kok-saghyz]